MFKSFFKNVVTVILILEARVALLRYRPKIIAITGSVGKTSTKDAVERALTPFFSVRKSEKSYNSDFGIPLTILGLQNAGGNPFLWLKNLCIGAKKALSPRKRGPQWLVLEVGAGEPGDIGRFAKILSPDIAVITRFAEVPVHVEFFKTARALIEEKILLACAVPRGGIVILGSDDEKVRALINTLPGRHIITYGKSSPTDVRGFNYSVMYEKKKDRTHLPVGFSFCVAVGSQIFQMKVRGALGEHLMQPILAAFAIGKALELDLSQMEAVFRDFLTPPGRMRLIQGINDSLIIDDSYNASPIAVAEALATLSSLQTETRKIAILGDMTELGRFSEGEHRKIGVLATRSCSRLVTVGTLAQGIARGAEEGGMRRDFIRAFKKSKEAAEALPRDIEQGDLVLVKGSQPARMERVVKALMQEPLRAKELLVRQEGEWQKWEKI